MNTKYLLISFCDYVNDNVDFIYSSNNLEALLEERGILEKELHASMCEDEDADYWAIVLDIEKQEVIHGNFDYDTYIEVVGKNLDMIKEYPSK